MRPGIRRLPRFAGSPSLAALLLAGSANAQSSTMELAWNAPAECPSRDAVLAEIARTLGHPPAGQATTVRADVTRDEEGLWHASVRIEAGPARSERTLDAATCPAVASAAALILAVAAEGGLPSEPPLPPEPARASREQSAPAAPSPAPPPPTSSKLLVDAGAVLDEKTMPSLAGGAELAVGWRFATGTWRPRAFVRGAFFPAQSTFLANRPTEGGSFRLLTASGQACLEYATGRLEVGPCVGGELDSMSATGIGPGSSSGSGAWVALLGSALGGWRLTRELAIVARVDAAVPLARPSFVAQTPGGAARAATRIRDGFLVGATLPSRNHERVRPMKSLVGSTLSSALVLAPLFAAGSCSGGDITIVRKSPLDATPDTYVATCLTGLSCAGGEAGRELDAYLGLDTDTDADAHARVDAPAQGDAFLCPTACIDALDVGCPIGTTGVAAGCPANPTTNVCCLPNRGHLCLRQHALPGHGILRGGRLGTGASGGRRPRVRLPPDPGGLPLDGDVRMCRSLRE